MYRIRNQVEADAVGRRADLEMLVSPEQPGFSQKIFETCMPHIKGILRRCQILAIRGLNRNTTCISYVEMWELKRSIIEVRENVCFACTEEVIPSSPINT